MKVLLAVVALVVVVVIGWAGYEIYQEFTERDSGIVTGKEYKPEHWSTYKCGKSTCMNHHPECWEIQYEGGDACVSEAEYATYNKGDMYPKGSK